MKKTLVLAFVLALASMGAFATEMDSSNIDCDYISDKTVSLTDTGTKEISKEEEPSSKGI